MSSRDLFSNWLPDGGRLVCDIGGQRRSGPETQPLNSASKRKPVNTLGFQCVAAIGVCLLSSCATMPDRAASTPVSDLPSDVVLNPEAGREMLLFVVLRLENGQEVPCAMDTGAPGSLLPQTFEPTLGKRLGQMKIRTLDSRPETIHIYAAPKIYLGQIPLARRLG